MTQIEVGERVGQNNAKRCSAASLCFRSPSHDRPSAVRRARGVSLLEVLFSIFILMFGLMGIAAMFPAGQYHVAKGLVHDRASAIGQSAFNDITSRSLLQPSLWLTSSGSAVSGNGPFAVDPLGVAVGYSNFGPMARVTLPDAAGTMDLMVAERIFLSRDDLTVVVPESADRPGTNYFDWTEGPDEAWGVKDTDDDGDGNYDVFGDRGWAGSDDVEVKFRPFEGRYSWLFTAVPAATSGSDDPEEYLVTVVVVHQRLLDDSNPGAGEQTVNVSSISGGGYGGGEIVLASGSPKAGQWLMLSGTVGTRTVARWYRIVAVDGLRVTLAGPDWNTAATTPQATMIDGAVGAFEKVMRLQRF